MRIGKDVIGQTSSTQHSTYLHPPSVSKVLSAFKQADEPMSISKIAKEAGVSWITARDAIRVLLLNRVITEVREGNQIKYKLKERRK